LDHPTSTECLAHALVPALTAACGGRLSAVQWFKSPWQRGGASTGIGTFVDDQGRPASVVVKVPVGFSEYKWTSDLAAAAAGWNVPSPVPRVLAGGLELGGYDLAWMVLEKLGPHLPITSASPADAAAVARAGECASAALRAVATFHLLAERVRPVEGVTEIDHAAWERAVAGSREAVRRGTLPDGPHWATALKAVSRALPNLFARWAVRAGNAWCHGDVHPGNVLLRHGEGTPQCVLIDLALMRPGHWLEDAMYFERVFWGREHCLGNINPLKVLSAMRRELGLPCTGDYGALANVKRVLNAAAAPGLFLREGNPLYLKHALHLIDKLLPSVAH